MQSPSKMLVVDGINVKLPAHNGEPFGPRQLEIQNEFMHKSINAFKDKEKPAFLESPEGTDRTATLICSALAWIEHQLKTPEMQKNKILYLCGTNDGLNRVFHEYNTRIKNQLVYNYEMIVLDSKKLSLFEQAEYDEVNKSDKVDEKEMTDTKEKKSVVKPCIFVCTHIFFFEVIMLQSKKNTCSSFKNTLVIFDDAHLVEETARNAMSATLSNCVVTTLINDLTKSVPRDNSELDKFNFQLKRLKTVMSIKPYRAESAFPEYCYSDLKGLLESIHDAAPSEASELTRLNASTNVDINNVNNVMKFILHTFQFSSWEQKELESVKGYGTEDYFVGHHMESCKVGSNCNTVQILCIDPSVLVQKVFIKFNPSVIFTSAAMSPVQELKTELQIESSNDYVEESFIEDFQVFSRIVKCGAGGYFLNSSFATRHDDDYLTSVGKTVLEFAKVTPESDGLLVYFVSTTLLDNCVSNWKVLNPEKESLWNKISNYKEIITISRKDQLNLENLNVQRGTCVLTSIRGQIPEHSIPISKRRVLVIVGVPYVHTEDPRLLLKKKYNKNKNHDENRKFLSPSKFEEREAYKLINRVVDCHLSSRSDYGVILMCDCRYRENELSPWLRNKVHKESRFNELIFELKDFLCHVKDRVSSTSANEDVFTQFGGKVKKWEFEKSRLEYLKLKRKNDIYTGQKERLEENLQTKLNENKLLEEELNRLKKLLPGSKTPVKREYPSSQSGNEESPTKVIKLDELSLDSPSKREEGSATQAGTSGLNIVSPVKVSLEELHILSPEKKVIPPYQGEGDVIQVESPPTSVSPFSRKRPYQE